MGERERGREGERQTGREGVRDRGREAERQRGGEAERERDPQPFGSSFCVFFFLFPLGLSYVSWASQECCFFT